MVGGDFRVAEGNGAKRPVVGFDDIEVAIPVQPSDDRDDAATV